ncbi:GIY-YIG nuclease family protein [Roseibium album]|uniref:GIY-YIG nuclease family protein n=1 Tax=Roseibium album TaxID=311410 RepID=UPI00391DCF17
MTVYVLHFDPPYQHARHYIGYTPDASAARRVKEHQDCTAKGSPLVRAAIESGCKVVLAHEFPGASRAFERWLKTRRDTSRWCQCCGLETRKLPDPNTMPAAFLESKPDYSEQGAA